MNVNVFLLRNIFSTLFRLRLLNSFEFNFLKSITREDKIMIKRVDSYYEYYDRFMEYTRISKKQSNIFLGLKYRFDNLDIFERYTDYFDLKKIKLDDYDKGYFETFKDEFEETYGFKRWLSEITNKN